MALWSTFFVIFVAFVVERLCDLCALCGSIISMELSAGCPALRFFMKRAIVAAVLVGLAASPLVAGGKGSVNGSYVEARTAEVFTGGCIMGSEAETVGKQAVLAWKVDRGTYNGIAIDGLSVVAAVSGDRNLGMTEMGGAKATVRSALFVDERANPAQRLALVALA